MLPLAVASESFKTISRRGAQILQDRSGVHHFELSASDPKDVRRKTFPGLSIEGVRRKLIPEASDHVLDVSSTDTFGK